MLLRECFKGGACGKCFGFSEKGLDSCRKASHRRKNRKKYFYGWYLSSRVENVKKKTLRHQKYCNVLGKITELQAIIDPEFIFLKNPGFSGGIINPADLRQRT